MSTANHSGVLVPPPLLYAGALLIVLILDWLRPLELMPATAGLWGGSIVLVMGLALNVWGAYTMSRARTPINPYRPVADIVDWGPFRLSRNPLYVGLNLVFLGLTLLINSAWGILLLVALLVVMHYGVILREERYLESRFGEAYREYCRKVRRYL